MPRTPVRAILLFLPALLLGCGGGGAAPNGPVAPEFSALRLSPDSLNLPVGGAVQVTVSPRDQNDAVMSGLPAATLVIEDTTIAAVNGPVVSGRAEGTTRLFASLSSGGVSHADTIQVVVGPASAGAPAHPVSTVGTSFAPQVVTIPAGDSVTWQFAGAVHNVTFSAALPPAGDIPDQASGSSVSRRFPGAGTFAYECTRHAGMTGTVIVQSGQVQVFTSVDLTPATASLLVGGTIQLVATALDQSGVPIAAAPAAGYSTTNPTVATVDPNGLVTAQSVGAATVTAAITIGGVTFSSNSGITVNAPATGPTVTTPSLTFAPPAVTIQTGETVTWLFSGATHNVSFTGLTPAGGDIPDQPLGSAVQRTFPTAGVYAYECTRHTGMAGTVTVQSSQVPVFSAVLLVPVSSSIQVGATVQLVATPVDQTGIPMAGLPAPVYGSGNPAVATVDGAGLVTGAGAGTTTVTATVTSGGVTHFAGATITVLAPLPGSVTVTTPNQTFSPSAVTIPSGGAVFWQFSGSTHNVTFTSTLKPAGGDVPDQAPGATQSRVFGTPGVYTYLCTRHNGMSGQVTVSGGSSTPVLTSLDVTPKFPFVQVGDSLLLQVTPLDQFGAPLPGLPLPAWSSSNPAVATVDITGVVVGIAPGTATITATLAAGGITVRDASAVTVGIQAGAIITTPGINFNPDDVTIPPGQTVVWQVSGTTHNITWDNIAPPGGNVPNLAPGQSAARTFPVTGDFKYHCTIHQGLKGRIRVQ